MEHFVLKNDGKIYWIQDMPVEVSNQVDVKNWISNDIGKQPFRFVEMKPNTIYSLQCSVEKLELMRENNGNPVVHSVKVLVTFPESGNKRDWTEDFTHENGNYMNKCANCGEQFKGHKRRPLCKECGESGNKTEQCQQCSSLKEENERLKADIKTIGQILKDGGWIDLFEKIIALNPTPKTEGTSI
jgi:hypothetical protein